MVASKARRGVQYDRVRVADFRHGPGYRFRSPVFGRETLPDPGPQYADDDDLASCKRAVAQVIELGMSTTIGQPGQIN